ncbi:DNA translocase FtsK [Salibacterium aidingense]|uniref:DNA translocase FtsK n=1 Tax=Salibacterium aidingense TaxID=384933 RepID=UPI00041E0648|nr:DNA translocase FtsK [Salibacterium aidingense]
MAGSFQRIKQKMQQFFFGGQEGQDSDVSARYARDPVSKKDRQLPKQSESNIKIVHHYPKSETTQRPLNNLQHKKAFEEEKTTPDFQKEKSGKEQKQAIDDTQAKERHYFQGNDFSPEDIPSPVFGFERVPLHSNFLKKNNHTVLPVPEETAPEDLKVVDLPPVEGKEEAASAAEEAEETITAYGEQITERSGFFEEEEEAKDDNPPQKNKNDERENVLNERLSRQERRRKKREERSRHGNNPGGETEKHTSKVPFNVLMYSDGQGSSSKPEKERAASSQKKDYHFPSIQLLSLPPKTVEQDADELSFQKEQLENTLQDFHVDAKVVDVTKGPSVTRYEVQPAAGVKVNKITNLTDDMKLALAAKDLRMEAPIPGKNAIGIEVPNTESKPVFLREILRRDVFLRKASPLTVAMGLDISGTPIVADLQDMPHGLIAGATGSGKSVCINSILLSLLYKADPEEVKLMLIDPKMVELASYKDVPHLVTPVINDAKEATAGLKWAVTEMNHRYEKLAAEGVRDIAKYNENMEKQNKAEHKMPYIVIVIDELADLMMVSPQDVEDAVCRIAQKARACGIHLLLATQRPSVDVITGLIKANIPSRTAFAVSSQADSRTILDMGGAERLIGKGDMLFHQNGSPKPVRVQGTFVTDEEIDAVTAFVKKQKSPDYLFQREELARKAEQQESGDELFTEACQFVSEQNGASSSLLQRRFSIGYNRAAKLIDMMEERGIISEARGSKPRQILLTRQEIEERIHA